MLGQEASQPDEVVGVVAPVRAVGVDRDAQVRMRVAHRAAPVPSPTRDRSSASRSPPRSGARRRPRPARRRRSTAMPTTAVQASPGACASPRPSAVASGDALAAQGQVGDGHVDRGRRHRVADPAVATAGQRGRYDEVAQHGPRRPRCTRRCRSAPPARCTRPSPPTPSDPTARTSTTSRSAGMVPCAACPRPPHRDPHPDQLDRRELERVGGHLRPGSRRGRAPRARAPDPPPP